MKDDHTSVSIVRWYVSSHEGMRGRTLVASRRSKGVRKDVLLLVAPANCWVSIMVARGQCKPQASGNRLNLGQSQEESLNFYPTSVGFLFSSAALCVSLRSLR